MQKLFENFRKYLEEAGDPDNPSDNEPSTQEMAKELEKRQIAKVVDDFGFNPGWKEQKDLIHWEVGAPIIEYKYKSDGTFDYKATIPGGQNPKNWKEILSEPEETIEAFLMRVKKTPHQLNLNMFENWREFVRESELETLNEDVAEYIPGTSAHKMRKAIEDDDQDGIENEDDLDHHREEHASEGSGGIFDYVKSGFSKLIKTPEKFDQLVEKTKNEFTKTYINKLQLLSQTDQMQKVGKEIANQIAQNSDSKALTEVEDGHPRHTDDASAKQFSLDDLAKMGVDKSTIELIAHTMADEGAEALIESAEKVMGKATPPKVRDWLVRFVSRFIGAFVFGFIDNFIMVIAGSQIDAQFGGVAGAMVGTAGAPMLAAGFGNTVSDAVGELASNTIEGAMDKMGLDPEAVTDEQVAAGPMWMKFLDKQASVIGIVVGCLVGLFPLFLEEEAEKDKTRLVFENWKKYFIT